MNKKIILLVLAIGVAVAVMGGYASKAPKWGNISNIFQKSEAISEEEAKEKAKKFIEENLVAPGTKVEIVKISLESDLYVIELDVEGQNVTAYMTKDGSKFFPQGMDISDTEKKAAEKKAADAEAEKNIPKSDKPVVDLYVMSFCPYGNKAEDTLKPVYDLLKDKVDFNFRYIVGTEGDKITSLHGQPEVDQNEREACVMKNHGKDAWMAFVTYVNANCGSDGDCWEAGASSLNIDTRKINACVSSEGKALMQADAKASSEAKASGSPTMLINGSSTKAVYQYGNSNSYKEVICNSFNEKPEECTQELSSDTSTAEGGSCN